MYGSLQRKLLSFLRAKVQLLLLKKYLPKPPDSQREKTDAESSASLYTSPKSNLRDRVWGVEEKRSFIALPGKSGDSSLMPQNHVS